MNKKLEEAIASVKKAYGKTSLLPLGSDEREEIEAISTGNAEIDAITGIGGIPRGRITEILGQESAGKSTLCLQIISQCQKAGGQAVYIDAEHALDPAYAEALGVNILDLLVSQPDNGEQALEIADMLIQSGAVDLIVVDSVAALVPRAELEGEMGDAQMGLMARLMSQAMRKLNGVTKRTNTSLVFINQLREKIGVVFGSPETTPGGRALKFFASLRIDIRKGNQIKKSEEVIGYKARLKIIKNKCASPYKTAEVNLLFGQGFVNAD
jgi:recombination protein RecA